MKTYAINDFIESETVYLKTDFSQPMTVTNIDIIKKTICCFWRDKKNNQSRNECFPPTVLCKEEDKPPLRSASITAVGD